GPPIRWSFPRQHLVNPAYRAIQVRAGPTRRSGRPVLPLVPAIQRHLGSIFLGLALGRPVLLALADRASAFLKSVCRVLGRPGGLTPRRSLPALACLAQPVLVKTGPVNFRLRGRCQGTSGLVPVQERE